MVFNLFLGSGLSIALVSLLAFSVLQWFHIPAGSFLDWVIGGASFWWLLVIVTVPWNIHFQAREVLLEAQESRDREIPVDPTQQAYVVRLATRSLWVALALHLLSTLGLYSLAATGISPVGYISSAAALLLTLLRPTLRGYEYLVTRLTRLQQDWAYPREDVLELRNRVAIAESSLTRLDEQLNPEYPYSLAAQYQTHIDETRNSLAKLTAQLAELRAENDTDHDRLSREARQSISQLSEDSQFLDHVREILRFFKSA